MIGPLKKYQPWRRCLPSNHMLVSSISVLLSICHTTAWLHLSLHLPPRLQSFYLMTSQRWYVSLWNISSVNRMMFPSVSKIFCTLVFFRFIVAHLWSVQSSILPEKSDIDAYANENNQKNDYLATERTENQHWPTELSVGTTQYLSIAVHYSAKARYPSGASWRLGSQAPCRVLW